MAIEIIMPKVDMVMEEGTFMEWLKREGDLVQKDEPLFIIMTDKAAIEIPAPGSGILAGVQAQPEDVIPVSQTIAYLLSEGEALPTGAPPSRMGSKAESGLRMKLSEEPEAPRPLSNGAGTRPRATPVARRMAARLGLDLRAIDGRGPKGRIHKADVLLAAEEARQAVPPTPTVEPEYKRALAVTDIEIPWPEAKVKKTVPLAGPRRIIAQRMAFSAATAPHIHLSLSVDMSEADRLRSQVASSIEKKTSQRLSFTAILARAVAATLPAHPFLNASLSGEEIVLWEDVHLGIATSIDDYLIVPVIREAQGKNLADIVATLADLVDRARSKRLAPHEMSGSTFTISNLGMYGIESFTAIINPPESAILAAGKMVETCVKTNEGSAFRPLMNLTICADHRVVDGAAAAEFLVDLKNTLENPYLLI